VPVKKSVLAAAVFMVMSGACSPRPEVRDTPTRAGFVVDADPSQDLFALGTELTPVGAVADRSVTHEVEAGARLFLSVNVQGATVPQTVELVWYDARGKVVDADRRTSSNQPFLIFDRTTNGWQKGTYKAEVFVNNRKVSEKLLKVS
jgi:hypothetical protein